MSTSTVSLMLTSIVAALLSAAPALGDENARPAGEPNQVSTTSALSPQAKAQVDAAVAGKVRRELDLSLGDVTHILTPEQLRAALGGGDNQASNAVGTEQLEQIEVHAARPAVDTTRIPFGFASIAWAVKHPTEAWRVFAPVVLG